MADLCCEYEFPNFTINDTGDGVDRLVLGPDGIIGLDGAPIRRQVDPKGQTDGGIVHDAFFGPRIVTWRGAVNIQSVEWDLTDEYIAALMTFEALVIQDLEAILNSDHTLTWNPGGLGSVSMVVRYGASPGGEIKFGGTMLTPTFEFTTISADPTIS